MTGIAFDTARCQASPAAGDGVADDVGGICEYVVEPHLGQVPSEAGQPPCADSRSVGGDDRQADVLGLLGADGDEVVAGRLAVVHVGLGAVEAEAVAFYGGGEADVALVPAVVALGDGRNQAHLAAGDAGQPVALLFLGAAFQDGEGGQDGGGQVRAGYGAAAQLLEKHAGIGERAALSAVLLRYQDAQPAGGGELAPRLQGRGLVGGRYLQQGLLGVFLGDQATGRRL